jgi:hypothetical protein
LDAPAFGEQRPTLRSVAAKALNGSSNTQRADVQIRVLPLEAQRLAKAKPTTDCDRHKRIERILTVSVK